MTKTSPFIRCHMVDSIDLDDWNYVDAVFKDADFAHFQQGWADKPAKGFRPGKAASAWTGNSLVVYSELCDDDIYNGVPENEFNRVAFLTGDVFEIFLKPSGQESYFEIHVSPNNQKLQLRLPCENPFEKLKTKFKSGEEMVESFKIWNPIVESNVRIDRAACKWWVVAKIPFSMLVEGKPVSNGDRWRFSFSRYDYTRHNKRPILSSTSPHAEINFHRLDEYGVMEFYS